MSDGCILVCFALIGMLWTAVIGLLVWLGEQSGWRDYRRGGGPPPEPQEGMTISSEPPKWWQVK